MNPIDIHRLQVLNDLVAQTIDIINQRNIAAAGFAQQIPGYYGAGLSHTPFTPYAQQPWGQQPWAQQPWPQQIGIVPQPYTNAPWGPHTPFAGLSHTPYAGHTPYVDPRWAFAAPPVFPMMPFVR